MGEFGHPVVKEFEISDALQFSTMQVWLEIVWWTVSDILFPFFAFVLSAILGTPFVLIGAAFDKGSFGGNVIARYHALWDWWLG